MKSRYYLPVLAAIILGLAGLGYAQQAGFSYEAGNGWSSTAQPPVSPDNNARDNFGYELGNVPAATDFSRPVIHRHFGKTGKLEIETPLKIGEVTLKPGKYLVRHVDNGEEHYVEFSQIITLQYPPEAVSPYQREVVAQANCTREPLNSVVARTELEPGAPGAMARLEIRGEKAVHLF